MECIPRINLTVEESEKIAFKWKRSLREPKQTTEANPCKDSPTLNKKGDDNGIMIEMDDKNKTSIIIKNINILKAREGERQESEKQDLDKEVESVMIVATPPSKGIISRKRKRETEEASPSVDVVSEKNLKETAPMILARRKTAAYKSSSASRKLAGVLREREAPTAPGTEEDIKPLKANAKRVRLVDNCGKWTSSRNGFRLNTRPCGSK